MKLHSLMQVDRIGRHSLVLLSLLASACLVVAADTNAPPAATTNAEPAAAKPEEKTAAPELTPEQMFEGGSETFNNWIEFGGGTFFTSGNQRQFQQNQQATGNPFGGIQDFHLQHEFTNKVMLTLDGHAIADENDYKARINVSKEKLGYIRFSYDQFRTWSNGDGGYYPPTDAYYSRSNDALGLDRGDVSFEAGLRLEKKPEVTFKYDHTYRDGKKSSTIWAPTHPTADTGLVRGLGSSFYDIGEYADIFQLDVTHNIKATDFGIGVRYETGHLNDALKITNNQGEPAQQKVTNKQDTSYDTFNTHFFTETWIKKNLLFSSGGSYTYLDNDFSGSRIYGSDFDVGYIPGLANGVGYTDLSGGSHLNEYVANLNLLYKPSPHVSIVPSMRVQVEDADANASGLQTVSVAAPTPFDGNSDRNDVDVRERLDLTYTGITNWVLYARGELTEGSGNLKENGGISALGPVPVNRETDDNRFFQKYSTGARWYATRSVILDGGGYYKYNKYDYHNTEDSTPNDPTSFNTYPAYLTMQSFETYDANLRLTLRPLRNVSTVSRYEFQYSTVNTKPDSIADLEDKQTSKMNSHIIAQDVNWTPWSRLYLQAGFNYVWSKTETPASAYTSSVLDAQNNYWTVNGSSTFVLDDKTDVRLAYVYYLANDYNNNSVDGVPYGAGAEEHLITAGLTRRITKNIRWNLKYGYSHYTDDLYGGHRDYDAHMVYSGFQYRF